ncbi:MBOAT family protein [Domibacillus sp. DTU_2020_1001157_1_SI_ALB_TIR_016]|uniref:MBOAT family O-acyltransferase n=1 Tax=Domibacillus sp. DTU_2020_1001157_1_SI_ALB_TIR_016 TaxID=3077789 RepID=UPI0028E31A62|nr:MBOAT family protein [Domibacillus sp. DTU_2020_1001157_1_SI_ALB_TIR_016]WNS78918.1 MBOAT family protein [Domibacillus sp. DTU_2020_1001157_1_SI_ALB_TIR_016]
MIFNSFEFIFMFLPVVFIVYFALNKINFTLSKTWLFLASLFFYGWWNPIYLPLLLLSLTVNYIIGTNLGKMHNQKSKKILLTVGILFNISLLGYFKYHDFFVENVNAVFGTDFVILNLVLPLAISFYTFQKIPYLVDSYRGETKGYNPLNYGLFLTFFPQLIAGPIVQHNDVMVQFEDKENRKINYNNIATGLFIFGIGLFKKVGIADTFAVWANAGYSTPENLTFVDSWVTSLSYTFQLYFDFSGYSDMAIGAALLFNIVLPVNFNSPYKALSIQDFWRRWHMTLSRFLTNYIYIPLGGNRKGAVRTYLNILAVFFISGIWHGAGWTFIIWGIMHGVASVINRLWNRAGFKLPKLLAWFITFQFVNVAWVFFRAPSVEVALQVLKSMIGLNGFSLPDDLQNKVFNTLNLPYYDFTIMDSFAKGALLLVIAFGIAVFAKNSIQLKDAFKPNWPTAVYLAVLVIYSVLQLQNVSEFLYFNF